MFQTDIAAAVNSALAINSKVYSLLFVHMVCSVPRDLVLGPCMIIMYVAVSWIWLNNVRWIFIPLPVIYMATFTVCPVGWHLHPPDLKTVPLKSDIRCPTVFEVENRQG